jgi:hypothetical protein
MAGRRPATDPITRLRPMRIMNTEIEGVPSQLTRADRISATGDGIRARRTRRVTALINAATVLRISRAA